MLLRCHSHAFVETLIVIITYFLRYVYYVTGDLFKKHVIIDIVNYSSIYLYRINAYVSLDAPSEIKRTSSSLEWVGSKYA